MGKWRGWGKNEHSRWDSWCCWPMGTWHHGGQPLGLWTSEHSQARGLYIHLDPWTTSSQLSSYSAHTDFKMDDVHPLLLAGSWVSVAMGTGIAGATPGINPSLKPTGASLGRAIPWVTLSVTVWKSRSVWVLQRNDRDVCIWLFGLFQCISYSWMLLLSYHVL